MNLMEIFTNSLFEEMLQIIFCTRGHYLSDSVDLYPKEVILPKGVTPSELSQISLQNMQTSENVAIAVALNSLGYEVQSEGDGVLVVGILDDSPVRDKLAKR